METISRKMLAGVLPEGDYWGMGVWEREVALRGCIYGLFEGVPEEELVLHRGGVMWQFIESLRDAGVQFSDMYVRGYYLYGFFDVGNYGDSWLSLVGRAVDMAGGAGVVEESLLGLGISSGFLGVLVRYSLLGEGGLDDGGALVSGGVGAGGVGGLSFGGDGNRFGRFRNVDSIPEDVWYGELLDLYNDAKLEGAKGFSVRREVLMLIGRRRGFVKDDGDGGVANALASITVRAMEIVADVQRRHPAPVSAVSVDYEEVE